MRWVVLFRFVIFTFVAERPLRKATGQRKERRQLRHQPCSWSFFPRHVRMRLLSGQGRKGQSSSEKPKIMRWVSEEKGMR